MRNLKKLLAMVLVLAMTLALVPFASAADFTDADKIVNKDAVELLVTLGILKGYNDGRFNPEGTLTRAEAAKVIYAATTGTDDGAGVFKGTQLFKDLAKGHWAEGYINYAAAMEYVAGHGNGIFNPEGKVTGYQYLKMILCALGYDAEIEKFVNTNAWEYNVLAIAIKNGLIAGFEGSLADALTRDNMALITANMISAHTVRYDTGKVVVNDTTFGEAKLGLVAITGILVANEEAAIDKDITEKGSIIKVGEKYVLVPANADTDMLGKEITALVSVKSGKTLRDAQGNFNSSVIEKVFSVSETSNNEIVEMNSKAKYDENAQYFINFKSATAEEIAALAKKAGQSVVAISNNGDSVIDVVIGIEYSFDKVSAISSKGVVTLAGNKLDGDNAVGISGLKSGDMAVWYKIEGGKYIVQKPEIMSAKATGYTSTYVVIGGKRYAPATGISGFVSSDAPLSKDANWFMFNDMILGCTEAGETLVASYALVTRSTKIGWEFRVEIVTDGGEAAVYTVANADDVANGDTIPFGLYTYSINDKGQIKLEAADLEGNTAEDAEFSYTREFNRINDKLINSKTIVFAQIEGKWVVYTGINHIPSLTGEEATRKFLSVETTIFENNDALAVIVLPNVALASDETSAEQHFIVMSDVVRIVDGKFTFKAWNGSEVVDLTSQKEVATGGIYTFTFASNGEVSKADAVSGQKGFLTHAADYTLRLGVAGGNTGNLYTYNDKTVVFEIDLDAGTVSKTKFADMTMLPADQVADKEAGSFNTLVVQSEGGTVTAVYRFADDMK